MTDKLVQVIDVARVRNWTLYSLIKVEGKPALFQYQVIDSKLIFSKDCRFKKHEIFYSFGHNVRSRKVRPIFSLSYNLLELF